MSAAEAWLRDHSHELVHCAPRRAWFRASYCDRRKAWDPAGCHGCARAPEVREPGRRRCRQCLTAWAVNPSGLCWSCTAQALIHQKLRKRARRRRAGRTTGQEVHRA